MDMDMIWADPVSGGSYSGTCGNFRARSDVIHGAPHGHDLYFLGRLHRFPGTDVQREHLRGNVLLRVKFHGLTVCTVQVGTV